MKKIAFTLAEVLIVLGVIGVVAALTIPQLLVNSQYAGYSSGLKENFSILNQATKNIINDYGGSIDFNYNVAAVRTEIINAYKSNLKVVESCEQGTKAGICWHDVATKKITNLTGADDWIVDYYWTPGSFYHAKVDTLKLANGSLVWILWYSNGLPADYYRSHCTTYYGKSCNLVATMAIDVNGFKGPNQRGRDIFKLGIVDPIGVVPFYAFDRLNQVNNCSKSVVDDFGCATKVLSENDMNY